MKNEPFEALAGQASFPKSIQFFINLIRMNKLNLLLS